MSAAVAVAVAVALAVVVSLSAAAAVFETSTRAATWSARPQCYKTFFFSFSVVETNNGSFYTSVQLVSKLVCLRDNKKNRAFKDALS